MKYISTSYTCAVYANREILKMVVKPSKHLLLLSKIER